MYVCVCQAVTERQVREAAQGGANSVKALKECLGVASHCGKCAKCAHNILRDCQRCAQEQEDERCAA